MPKEFTSSFLLGRKRYTGSGPTGVKSGNAMKIEAGSRNYIFKKVKLNERPFIKGRARDRVKTGDKQSTMSGPVEKKRYTS